MTVLQSIRDVLSSGRSMNLREIYAAMPEELEHTIRARIYENLGTHFRRLEKGVYVAVHGSASCVLVSGDAWEKIKEIPSSSIDALITDPPYPWLDGQIGHGSTRPRMRWGFERREVDFTLGVELYRVLKEGAHALIFVPAETGTTKAHVDRFIALMGRCGFRFNKRMIWDKVILGMGYSGRARYEGILLLSKGKKRIPQDLGMADVIQVPAIAPARRIHPTEKPIELLKRLVRFATAAGETILDCFAGSCSTGVAALSLGRNSIMIEKALAGGWL